MKETIANQAIEIQDLKNKVKQAESLSNMWFQKMMELDKEIKTLKGEGSTDERTAMA